jgi:NAD(P)-dependent dehydrogenase (short-subunit alcohol dehydrogenase family)
MGAAQKPIGSGFSAKSTAAEVVRGIDLSGKTAIVTGGYSGIGIETVRALAGAGAEIIVPARSPDRAKEALGGIPRVSVAAMDLADLASVMKFARDFAVKHQRLHILINNAGVMATPFARIGNGWEQQFAINHLGHFVLTRELTPLLRAAGGARVVALSSLAHRRTDILWDDIHFGRAPYDKWVAYGQSKTANALHARALDAREAINGVHAYSVHPGGIMTPLQRHLEVEEMIALGWMDASGGLSEMAKKLFKTPEQGGATAAWCATSAQLVAHGGAYCEDCDIAGPFDETVPWRGVKAHSASDEGAARLWGVTEAMLG